MSWVQRATAASKAARCAVVGFRIRRKHQRTSIRKLPAGGVTLSP
jgi:hypothetical protein